MKNIAILMGGTSKENQISLKSAETIYQHIDKKKYNAYKVLCLTKNKFELVKKSGHIAINNKDFSFIQNGAKINFEKVFMMIHGAPGENGQLCSYFEKKGIPYTSCNELTSQLTFNKFKCNNYLRSIGYMVPKSQIYTPNSKINYPCIVKPSCSGSSFGITKVDNENDIKEAVKQAGMHDKEVIIEDFINGREVTCAAFYEKNQIKTLPITEIISQNAIFDYDAKYNGKSIEETPAKISEIMKYDIENISKNIYKDLNLSGIIRIDFIIHKKTPYIIEINTIPGFSEESIVPQMLKCADIKIKTFITQQLESI